MKNFALVVVAATGFLSSAAFGQTPPPQMPPSAPKQMVKSVHINPAVYCATIQPDQYPEYTIFITTDPKLMTVAKIQDCIARLPKKFESRELIDFFLVEDFRSGVAEQVSCTKIKPVGMPLKYSVSFIMVQHVNQRSINACIDDVKVLPAQLPRKSS